MGMSMFHRALAAEKEKTKAANEAAAALVETLAEHKQHLQGCLLVLHVLCAKAGGEIRIKESELQEFGGKHPKVRQGFDTETKEWVFIAEEGEEPKPKEPPPPPAETVARETDNGVKLELVK